MARGAVLEPGHELQDRITIELEGARWLWNAAPHSSAAPLARDRPVGLRVGVVTHPIGMRAARCRGRARAQ